MSADQSTATMLTLADINNADQKARRIVDMYRAGDMEWQNLYDRWAEVRKFVFASDTTYSSDKVGTWRNRTTIPKLTWVFDKLKTTYIQNLFPSDDFFRWKASPGNEVDTAKAGAIEHLMIHKLKHPMARWREVTGEMIDDLLLKGNIFASAEFVEHFSINFRTGQPELVFRGPRPVRIDPMSIKFNASANTFDNTYTIVKYVYQWDQFFEMAKRTGWWDEEIVEKVRAALSGNYSKDLSDWLKEEHKQEDDVQFYTGWKKGEVAIYVYDGSFVDESTNLIATNQQIAVVENLWLLGQRENPSYLGIKPIVHAPWRKRSEHLIGMGPLENLVGMQHRIDHEENMKADALDLTVFPIRKIMGEPGMEEYKIEPGAEWVTPVNGDVQLVYPDARAMQHDQQIMQYAQWIEEFAGVPRETAGFRTPGEKTAFEVDQLLNNSERHFEEKILEVESRVVEPLLNMCLELQIRNLTEWDLQFIREQDQESWQSLTIDDLRQDGRLYPHGAKHFRHRQAKIQKLQSLGQLAAQVQGGADHMSTFRLMKAIEREMGVDEENIIAQGAGIMERQETQQLVQGQIQEKRRQDVNG